MKTIVQLLVLSLTSNVFALNIYSANISANSPTAINVSLTTEAEELYYFHSWQYTIIENTISLEVCFVSGFGSTIAYLNNNFEIPLNTSVKASHVIHIKVYYTDLISETQSLQNEMVGYFDTPLKDTFDLIRIGKKLELSLYPNPTAGKLYIGNEVKSIYIFDKLGRQVKDFLFAKTEINLSELQEGIYFVQVLEDDTRKMIPIILKKSLP